MNISNKSLAKISVTGYGCTTAAGRNCQTAWQNLLRARVNNKNVPTFFPAPCFYAEEDETSFQILNKKRERPYNRTISLALRAIDEALAKAGLSLEEIQGKRVGLALGTTVGSTFDDEAYYRAWEEGKNPDLAPMHQHFDNNLAAYIQGFLGIQGPRIVITNACASGTDAIGMAKIWLEHGLCDLAIAGGADALSRIACNGFKSLRLISEESCRPFDAERQGLNLGEGAGILIMERYCAEQEAPLGFVRGYGVAGDAYHPTAPHPQGRGLQLAIAASLKNARLRRDDISMINAHGTGTAVNDQAETQAVLLAGFNPSTPMVSTKGITGHTLGAAGGVEAVFTLMALNQGYLPGTVGCQKPDPLFAFPIIPEKEKRQLQGRMGMSQSLAFGGSNSALILEGTQI